MLPLVRAPGVAVAVLLSAALAGAAAASDGVLEINQTCATTTGCFPGDTAGFPVNIAGSTPARSFRLTGDLTLASGAQSAISIGVANVTIELGGFRIVGPNVCSGVPVSSCSASGAGIGIAGGNDVTVKNGTVTGVGSDAINLTYSARVENVNVFHAGGTGLVATDLAVLRGNIVTSNGGDGIRCRDYCVVSENTATGNLGDGIDVRAGTVNGNTATLNGGRGGLLGGITAFAHNYFSGNVGPDVEGGHASGGNACEDQRCDPRGARRFFLISGLFTPVEARSVCPAGFHFAALHEMLDPTALRYDDTQLFQPPPRDGRGPFVDVAGWVRTGSGASTAATPGVGNCNLHQSLAGADRGTAAWLDGSWNGTPVSSEVSPWSTNIASCAQLLGVWCIED